MQCALEGQYLILAFWVAEQLKALGALTGGLPTDLAGLSEMLQQPDGSQATRAQLEQFDIGKLHLEAQDETGAQGLGVPLAQAPGAPWRGCVRATRGPAPAG
ncbi:MAG TPA: hypothetical protein VES73_10965 [Lamprocystis sp. (in: g-proteobacteria)]|nr:hypothetical protein [Lamprocystis sp. (in: g-proteobacteria)]